MNEEIISQKCKAIKLLAMDVDGTLTDGAVYYSSHGEELKRFSIRDGMGMVLLKLAGIEMAIITAEESNIVKARASKLNIRHLFMGIRNKKNVLEELKQKLNLGFDEIAFIGDDINDIQALKAAGLSLCPADSVAEVKGICDYICNNNGGNGAIREVAEMILNNQNKSISLPNNWK